MTGYVRLTMLALLLAGSAPAAQELGMITFPTSGAPAAQPAFLEGVKALHSFEFDAAALAFQRAQKADPGFALAFWGEAMSYNHPLWAQQDIEAAKRTLDRLAPTHDARLALAKLPKEKVLLDAMQVLYFSPGDKLARDRAYSESMAGLYARWPTDHEIATLYALSLLGTVRPGDTGYRRQALAASIAQAIYSENPRHPGAAHFIIHSFDDPDHAPLALAAANAYAKIAPAAAHALHMPSHIYVQLGSWQQAAASNVVAYKASVDVNTRLKLAEGREDFHTLSWLVYANLMLGHFDGAKRNLDLARQAAARNPNNRGVQNGYLGMRARYILESAQWEKISLDTPAATAGDAHAGMPGMPGMASADPGNAWIFIAGLSAAKLGDSATATAAEARLRAAREKATAGANAYAGREVAILEKEVGAAARWAAGQTTEALRLAKDAADMELALNAPSGPPDPMKPALELYGEMLLEANRPEEAATTFTQSLLRTPKRTPSLLGLARASAKAGTMTAARQRYAELAAMPGASPMSPAVLEAQKFLERPGHAVKILVAYLRNYKGLIALALGLATINQVFSLLDPLIFRYVIDEYATRFKEYSTRDFFRGVSLLLGAAVGVAFVSRVAKNFQDYVISVITQRLGAQLYADGIRHSLDLPYSTFEDQRSGETLGKLQKVRTDVEKLIAVSINVLFTSLVGIIFVMIYAFSVHWLIAPVYFLTVPLLGILSSILSRKIKVIQKVIVAETTALAGSTTESLRNIELVKSLGLAQQEIGRLNATTDKILGLELRKVRYLRSLSFIQGTAVNFLRTSILFLMLYLIYAQQITVGQFFSLFIYSFFIFGPLQELGNVINTYRETEASLANFEAILAIPKERRPLHPVPIGPLMELAFDSVGFQHQTASLPALTDISFAAARGETVAFVGPSGAGKTTLVKLLVGLYTPQTGQILYNGQPSTDVDLERLRERIGFVTQDTQLFSGTIRENLLFVSPRASDADCLEVLHQAACDSLLARADKGLDTVIGEGGVKVSGGEKQRLSIARALLRRPELLVFDEATSSLDSLTEEGITETIRSVGSRRDVITLMIAHRLSTVFHADRIVVLEQGRIVESGRHDELIERKGLYYAMWRQQIGERRASPLPIGASAMATAR